MSYSKVLYVFLSLGLFLATFPAHATEVQRKARPNTIGMDVLGRAYIFGFTYDRVLLKNEQVALGAGFAFPDLTQSGSTESKNALIFPVYANYYFKKRSVSDFFATGGLSWISNNGDLAGYENSLVPIDFAQSTILPHIGVGYEIRMETTLLLRFTLYETYASHFVTNAGITVGMVF